MAYNVRLAQRMRESLAEINDLEEKKMFGGVGFLIQGNMACGVNGDDIIVRVGPERYEEALSHPSTRPFDMTGRPMSGWVVLSTEGVMDEADLKRWITLGVEYARTLPAK